MKRITKENGMIVVNITPMFYIMLYQQWTYFFNKEERIRGVDIIYVRYERDYRLDRHNLVFSLLGFIIAFRKNVFEK